MSSVVPTFTSAAASSSSGITTTDTGGFQPTRGRSAGPGGRAGGRNALRSTSLDPTGFPKPKRITPLSEAFTTAEKDCVAAFLNLVPRERAILATRLATMFTVTRLPKTTSTDKSSSKPKGKEADGSGGGGKAPQAKNDFNEIYKNTVIGGLLKMAHQKLQKLSGDARNAPFLVTRVVLAHRQRAKALGEPKSDENPIGVPTDAFFEYIESSFEAILVSMGDTDQMKLIDESHESVSMLDGAWHEFNQTTAGQRDALAQQGVQEPAPGAATGSSTDMKDDPSDNSASGAAAEEHPPSGYTGADGAVTALPAGALPPSDSLEAILAASEDPSETVGDQLAETENPSKRGRTDDLVVPMEPPKVTIHVKPKMGKKKGGER